jgi:hypothetical protein
MTSRYNQAFVKDTVFNQLSNEDKLIELADFVMESSLGPLQRDVELFEIRLDAYAGFAGMDIISARIKVCLKAHERFNRKLQAYGVDVK